MKKIRPTNTWKAILIWNLAAVFLVFSLPVPAQGSPTGPEPAPQSIFLPLVFEGGVSPASAGTPRVNIPHLAEKKFAEAAVFWFGQVTPEKNYVDVRIAYSDTQLWVHVAVVDRFLWYDPSGNLDRIAEWDSVSLYMNLNGPENTELGKNAYRFDSLLDWWEKDEAFQAAYRGTGSSLEQVDLPFTTESGWRGNAPNDTTGDQGWTAEFAIPFSSLGLSAPPPEGTSWGLGVELHDRDAKGEAPLPAQTWPAAMISSQPSTWGRLHFGLPVYSPPAGMTNTETIIVRHKLDGQTVIDGMVGGSTNCAKDVITEKWTDWGSVNYAGADQVNVQNETDISDWACFSKFYITFPLDRLPTGRAIESATLTLFSIGNSGGGEWGEPPRSLVQVMVVGADWKESELTWNNAPLALENVSRTWVDPIIEWPGWPGVPRTWDLSYAVAQAYSAGQPLRLVLYSADTVYHTGRYFSSSDTGDWNAKGRPRLEVTLGQP